MVLSMVVAFVLLHFTVSVVDNFFFFPCMHGAVYKSVRDFMLTSRLTTVLLLSSTMQAEDAADAEEDMGEGTSRCLVCW